MAPSDAQIRRGGAARERILETAYDLFSRSGTRAVGVDTIIAESGVAKMTLYRNFASKDDLILEFLRQRDERWTRAWLQAEVERARGRPGARMLAIFDVFGEWFAARRLRGLRVHQRHARARRPRARGSAARAWSTSSRSAASSAGSRSTRAWRTPTPIMSPPSGTSS